MLNSVIAKLRNCAINVVLSFYNDLLNNPFCEVFVDAGDELLFAEEEFLLEGGDVGMDGEFFVVEADAAGVFGYGFAYNGFPLLLHAEFLYFWFPVRFFEEEIERFPYAV